MRGEGALLHALTGKVRLNKARLAAHVRHRITQAEERVEPSRGLDGQPVAIPFCCRKTVILLRPLFL